jgi:sporulation integral membrane protein YtvI
MTQVYTRHKQTIDRTAFFAAVTVFVFVFFKYLFSYIAPFFFGVLIALIMEPIIARLTEKTRTKRWVAASLCLLIFMAAVISLGSWVIALLARQTVSFVEAMPLYVDDFLYLIDQANAWLNNWTNYSFPDMRDAILAGLANFFGSGVRDRSLKIVSNMPDFFIGLILTFVSAFFFMKDKPRITAYFKQRCPEWLGEKLRIMQCGFKRAVGGYVRAQVILMTIVGIIGISGLLILRNPYALMIGLIMAFLDFLPIVGSGSVLIPWALFHVLTGDMRQAVGLLALYGVITIVRQVLEPKILGEQIGMHPLLSLMSVYIGFKIFGIIGIILGPVMVMVGVSMKEGTKE